MHNLGRILFGLTLLTALGCKDDEPGPAADPKTDECQAPLVPIYMTPGCGTDVHPTCLGGAGACGGSACGCDGKLISACNGWTSQKYQFVTTLNADPDSCKPAK